MTKAIRQLAVWIVAFLLALLARQAIAQLPEQVSVSVKPIYVKDSGWNIEATVTNLGDRPLTVADAYLPWGNRYAMVLAAFIDKRPNTTLQLGYPVDDPLFNRIVIPPKGTVSGKVPLSNYFPGLAETVKSNRILIIWSYQLVSDEHGASERRAGSFAIPPQ